MDIIKIVMTRSLLAVDKEYITNGLKRCIGDSFKLVEPEAFDEDSICKIIFDADVLLGPFVTKKMLDMAPNLKLIQVPWTGMDMFDFDSVADYKIAICNTHSSADSVAELGVSLILDLIKKISYHDRKMRIGNWNREQKPLNLKSRMLSKQTVCILGCGKIGYKIAKLVHAFGAIVIAVAEKRSSDDVIDEIYSREKMFDAFGKSDIVVVSLPLTENTRGLIDRNMLKYSKKDLLLINVSRAEVIDEDAVYEALYEGKIGGFASDVWWNAPKRGETQSFPSTHNKFWELENVVMSPHRAGFIEGCLPHLDEAITNIANLIQGKQLINIVDIKKHY